MTRIPGRFLLKVAELVFDDSVLATVVRPTIADLQTEVRDAGGDRVARLRARIRGYAAFWLLVGCAPVAFHAWPTRSIGSQDHEDRTSGTAFAFYVAAIVLCAWNFLGWWTAVAFGGGLLFAVLIHRWHGAHPIEVATREPETWSVPQINLSRIPVDGNIAGLMYVVGSLAIVFMGLPAVRWFFFLTVTLGVACAVALVAWHNAHPRRGNSVLLA